MSFYSSLSNCNFETSALTSTTLSFATPSQTVYFKTNTSGVNSLVASVDGYSEITASVTASFTSFNLGTGFNNSVNVITVQSDGKILVGGDFTQFNGSPAGHIVRLNSDGSLDTSFAATTGFNDNVFAIALQSNGNILVGGQFSTYNGSPALCLAWLSSTGVLNTAINTTYNGFDGKVKAIAVQSDGNVYVGGNFSNYNNPGSGSGSGSNFDYIVQLDSTGVPAAAPYADSVVLKFTLDSSNNLFAVGQFSMMNGNTVNGLTKMNSSGVVSPGFLAAQGDAFLAQNFPKALALQSDGKLIIGGDISDYDSHSIGYIVRVNSTGTFDSAYTTNLGVGFDGPVLSLALQNDGKALVGGIFTTLSGSIARSLARVNTDGTIDSTFVAKIGTAIPAASGLSAIAVQSDGKILLGGDFTTYNGTTVNRIKRITISGEPD